MRVVLADDHSLFRRGLAEVLEEEDDIEVVAQASDGREAVELALEHTPDVVFMDLNMPGQNGIEATAFLSSHLPQAKVLVLTVSEEPVDLFRALSVGALGYVIKTASPAEIVEALRQVHQGWVVISPAMAPRFLSDLGRAGAGPAPTSPGGKSGAPEVLESRLTIREQEILRHVARGMSNAEIARAIFITENTVKTHIKNILGKLHSKNRSEAVAYASRMGILEGPPA